MSTGEDIARIESDGGRPAILVVDDDAPSLRAIQAVLSHADFPVLATISPVEALAILERQPVAVVLADYQMEAMNGAELLSEVHERWPKVQRIVITGDTRPETVEQIVNRCQVFRFVFKPWDALALKLTVEAAFEQYRILGEHRALVELTERQNRELKALNRGLEAKVAKRTIQLERAKIEWEHTFDAIVDSVAVIDSDFRVVRSNLAFARTGEVSVRDVPGSLCYRVIARRDRPCEGCPLPAVLTGGAPRGADIPARGGQILNVWAFPLGHLPVIKETTDISGTQRMVLLETEDESPPSSDLHSFDERGPLVGVCHYRDVTAARSLQNTAARAERLTSLSLLVEGVAHEINNPLGSILLLTQLLLRSAGGPEELNETLLDIEQSAVRCKRIVRSLMAVAQGFEQLQKEQIDVRASLAETVRAFGRDYQTGERVAVVQEIDADTPLASGDPALIDQVIRRLLQNAVEAMENGGTITVRAKRANASLPVLIEVEDTGPGIAPENLSRIFDPFFTTKADRGASGLGLPIAHRILERHGGQIEVHSQPGRTTFRLLLPGSANDLSQVVGPKR